MFFKVALKAYFCAIIKKLIENIWSLLLKYLNFY
jgi:hypothetical protein